MNDDLEQRRKQSLAGKIHGTIWMLGLAILFYFNFIWPGILILVAISLLVKAILSYKGIDIEEKDETDGTSRSEEPVPLQKVKNLFPGNCPKCGAPLKSVAENQVNDSILTCPYCGAQINSIASS